MFLVFKNKKNKKNKETQIIQFGFPFFFPFSKKTLLKTPKWFWKYTKWEEMVSNF